MEFEVVKGFYDYDPEKMIKTNKVLEILKKNFESFGFLPFDTPIIEYFKTLTNKYEETDEIITEIFRLSDKGGRDLGLRYDLTIPLCRFIAGKPQFRLPFKRFATGKVFRNGPIKPGRTREFIQCDADIVGIEGRGIEGEVLIMFFKGYTKIGINAIIEINNNKILRGGFLQEGFKEEDLTSLILSVDKLKKIGRKGVLEETKQKGFDEKKVLNVIDNLTKKSFEEILKVAKDETFREGIEELLELTKILEKFEVKFRVNFSMSRGLNVYTGNIWEAYDLDGNIKSSIGGGGRFDEAIGRYIENGKNYPALGVSFGLVPILECLKAAKGKNQKTLTQILIVPLKEEVLETGFKLGEKLREKGMNIETYYGFKLKKAFDYAMNYDIGKILIFGERDIKKGEFTIKNLKTKEEEIFKL